ncbi:hypothetical protein, partial [Methanopyrus kandleri]
RDVGLPVVPSAVRPPDASWAAAILTYLLEEVPIVYGPKRTVLSFSAVYRTPVKHRPIKTTPGVEVDYECVVVQTDSRYVYVHCTRYGVAAVPRDVFDSACGVLATTVDHSPPQEDAGPSEVADHVLTETGLPVLAAVDSEHLNPEHATGTVPFVVAVEEGWMEDWKEGVEHDLPADRVGLTSYLTALTLRDRLPVYHRDEDGSFKEWLRKHEREIIGRTRQEEIDPVVEIAQKLEGCLKELKTPEDDLHRLFDFLRRRR